MTVIYTVGESLFKAAVLIDVSKRDLRRAVWTSEMTRCRGQYTVQGPCALVHTLGNKANRQQAQY